MAALTIVATTGEDSAKPFRTYVLTFRDEIPPDAETCVAIIQTITGKLVIHLVAISGDHQDEIPAPKNYNELIEIMHAYAPERVWDWGDVTWLMTDPAS